MPVRTGITLLELVSSLAILALGMAVGLPSIPADRFEGRIEDLGPENIVGFRLDFEAPIDPRELRSELLALFPTNDGDARARFCEVLVRSDRRVAYVGLWMPVRLEPQLARDRLGHLTVVPTSIASHSNEKPRGLRRVTEQRTDSEA